MQDNMLTLISKWPSLEVFFKVNISWCTIPNMKMAKSKQASLGLQEKTGKKSKYEHKKQKITEGQFNAAKQYL